MWITIGPQGNTISTTLKLDMIKTIIKVITNITNKIMLTSVEEGGWESCKYKSTSQ